MEPEQMKEYIKDFSLDNCPLGNQGYTRVLLQLFGYAGHGKSSFINSCKYVMDDAEYAEYAKVADSIKGPETLMRNSYLLANNVTLVDNRGAAKMDKMEIGEIYLQLGNFLPLDSPVVWQTNFSDMMNKVLASEKQECATDFIVPIFVYSAKAGMLDAEIGEIISCAKKITGLEPTVVVTHGLSIPAAELNKIKDKFRDMGAGSVYPLENYTQEDNMKTRGKHKVILRCLYKSLKNVEFRMKDKLDPIQERIERKGFLITYAHERGVKEARDRGILEERERAIQEARQKAIQEARAKQEKAKKSKCPIS
ncbi:uncharacterized protein LOC116407758 [Xenopus tropicalis]|uniref:Uncharacterized protein LOC116407758 n=1 Tax=Xenopus tropicalis TaxID=8364 RepID=A0A8J1IXW1_XENTR|nr:uncharacterized protein LOC116407758 [Xenopus tropicalis]